MRAGVGNVGLGLSGGAATGVRTVSLGFRPKAIMFALVRGGCLRQRSLTSRMQAASSSKAARQAAVAGELAVRQVIAGNGGLHQEDMTVTEFHAIIAKYGTCF